MPKYKSKKRSKGKKAFRSKNYKNSKGSTQTRSKNKIAYLKSGPTMWPDQYHCKLTYATYVYYAGALAGYKFFRGNGPYDPEEAVGGGQPEGYDQLAAMYRNYRCTSSKIVVKPVQVNGGNVSVATMWTVAPQLDTSSHYPTTTIGYPYAKSKAVTCLYSNTPTIVNYISSKKILGRGDDKTYEAAVDALPSGQWYWQVSVQTVNENDNMDIYAIIYLTYWITFYGREDPYDQ